MITRQREITKIKEKIAIRENAIQATVDNMNAIYVRIESLDNENEKDALEEWEGEIAESHEYIAAIEREVATLQQKLSIMEGETFYVRPSEKTRPKTETTLRAW